MTIVGRAHPSTSAVITKTCSPIYYIISRSRKEVLRLKSYTTQSLLLTFKLKKVDQDFLITYFTHLLQVMKKI